MPKTSDSFPITLGVEEELFLVNPESRDLFTDCVEDIFEECRRNKGPHQIVPEFLRAQIETNTKVCHSLSDLREAVTETRNIVINAAAKSGAAAMATSTHPFTSWRGLEITPGERYEHFAMTFQEGVRRFVIGGMHIHAGFGNPDSRIRVMTALRRYLPLLHALSTSSPFNEGYDTGFKSYRLSLVGGLPRTGMPAQLDSWVEYERLVEGYRQMKFIDDSSELWWDIRPSPKFPTIELRICDMCTRVEDAMCIAAIYACLIRRLSRLERAGALPREPLTEIIAEDRWIAQRYGIFAYFGDPGAETGRIDIADFLDHLLDELAEDAEALDCEKEIRHAVGIIKDGASADRQIDLFRMRRLEGDSIREALHHVVDLAIAGTGE
ncbi:MAG: carboxylate-amine ligase [Rhodobacteraceae bacterium]|nr:carboxylate-amine ligase [Paracoccaceae bacterium]